MVKGLDKFRDHFTGFTDRYVLIGGVASDLIMGQAGVDFRLTKDLDIVLCVEAIDREFVRAFWEFVKQGGYQHQQMSTGKKIFYRFNAPTNADFPSMLELFSRTPDTQILGDDSHLTPIPVAEGVSSLSAILLDGDYYQFIHDQKIIVDGLPVVSAVCLIPLKAKAWLDLSQRREAGENIDSRDIKKHRNDVFRLFQILSPELRIKLPETIAKDMHDFLEAVQVQETEIVFKDLGLGGLTLIQITNTLRQVYELAR
jgi:hypothetical protein